MMRFSPITQGKLIKSAEVEGFVLIQTRHSPSLVIPKHAHERPSLSFALKGSFIETLNQKSAECTPFSLIIKPAGEIHANRYSNAGAESLIIEVKQDWATRVRALSRVLDCAALFEGRSLALLAMRLYAEFRVMDVVSPLSIEGMILEMLADASRWRKSSVRGRSPLWLRRVVELIREGFAQDDMTISQIAVEVGVHPAHLARTFRQVYHSSVGDYVRKLRLEYAARELAHSERPLAEIAALAGFYDQSHLTRTFQHYLKTTPSNWRAIFNRRSAVTKRHRSSKTSS